MQTYELGATGDRIMMVKNGDDGECINIVLMVKGQNIKCVQFPPTRFAALCEHIDDVNIAARAIESGSSDIKLRLHLGGGYHISVTSGYRCVDIRKFYKPYQATESEIRPTKRGIALRLDEWAHLCCLTQSLKDSHPSLSSQPCYLNHLDQATFLACTECRPFDTIP